ncbi:MAG TPA: hypothetical protein VK922_05060, partial [Gemmatimonadaceae bacterium]|nr:hypothetical protein [Gemmatimonadaceae bacterium]
SELKHGRTEKTEDVVKKGDKVKVKLLERDERGRLRLSMKALVEPPEGMAASEGRGDRRGPRSEGGEEGSGERVERAAVASGRGEGEGDGGRRPRRGGGRPRR